MDVVFESDNVCFARVSEEFIEDYLAMLNDAEHVARFISASSKPYTAEKEAVWVQKKLTEKAPVFSMVEKASGAFIGNIELADVEDGVGMLGVAITAAQQDRGFGTEAVAAILRYGFETLGLKRIWLKALPFNARALHVYEKCGFREYDRTEEDVYMEIFRGGELA